jgi:hypothetical protein
VVARSFDHSLYHCCHFWSHRETKIKLIKSIFVTTVEPRLLQPRLLSKSRSPFVKYCVYLIEDEVLNTGSLFSARYPVFCLFESKLRNFDEIFPRKLVLALNCRTPVIAGFVKFSLSSLDPAIIEVRLYHCISW